MLLGFINLCIFKLNLKNKMFDKNNLKKFYHIKINISTGSKNNLIIKNPLTHSNFF